MKEPQPPAQKAGVKAFHRRVMLACGVLFVLSAAAAFYVATFSRGLDLPNAMYALNPGRSGPGARLPESSQGSLICWGEWGPAVFEQARRQDKLIFLYMASTWSHWCHLMDETTFADAGVADWIGKNVVALRVDSDVRPDLAQRYLGGWPTSALLLPTGETLSAGAYVPPERFIPWGEQVVTAYSKNRKALLEAREKARREAQDRRDRILVHPRQGRWDDREAARAVDACLDLVSGQFDAAQGGFGGGRKFHLPAIIRFLLERHEAFHDAPSLRMAARSLQGAARLEDPVWGGLYRCSSAKDWSNPEHEKLLSAQAAAVLDFATVGARSADKELLAVSGRAADFVRKFMQGPAGFFNSVDADLRRAKGRLEGARYYALGDAARRAAGFPETDKTVYTGSNAELAEAFLAASGPLGRPELGRTALGVLDLIAERGVEEDGAVRHALGQPEVAGLLEDQLAVARAETAAYAFNKGKNRLRLARKVLAYLDRNLKDPASGGYEVKPAGSSRFARPPVEGWTEPVDADRTAEAGMLYCDLSRLTGDPSDRKAALRLASWVAARREALDPVVFARLALRVRKAFPGRQLANNAD